MQSKKISKSKKVGFGSKTINYKDVGIVTILIIVIALTVLKFLNS